MSDFTVKKSAFAKLNNVLGVSTPPIPYAWNGSDVLLRTGRFNEKSYLLDKLGTLLRRESVLSREEKEALFNQVIAQNQNILFDMHSCSPDMIQQYDHKFNLLLESAFSHKENEKNLRISKENVKNSQQLSDGWMSASAVNNLLRLRSTNPAEAPDPNKFVPKHRR